MLQTELQVHGVIDVVRRVIPLKSVELPEEFFPAHLSVALFNAVFRPHLGEEAAALVERYCRRFGIDRKRAERWTAPSRAKQETLRDFINRWEELRRRATTQDFTPTCEHLLTTRCREAEALLRTARALRDIEVEFLQDLSERRPEEIEYALQVRAGVDEGCVRRLLMYTGDENFVRADLPIRMFVARALGVKSVSAAQAEGLLREAAHELILPPRFLDWAMWAHSSSSHGSAPFSAPCEKCLLREAAHELIFSPHFLDGEIWERRSSEVGEFRTPEVYPED